MTDPKVDPHDPNDPTARYDTPGEPPQATASASSTAPTSPATPPPVPPATAASQPGWAAPPPVTGPAWRPPASSSSNLGPIVLGLILVGVGLWFFADVSLGYDLPRISWSQLWPVFIIGVGAWIALGSFRRGSR